MVLRIMRRKPIAPAAILVLLVLGAAALFFREAIAHGFSAREEPWAIEKFVARRLRRLAIGSEVKQMRNPVGATTHAIAEGRDHFADHCALCHANNGSGETRINEGLYPPAPDLRQSDTQDLSDGEILHIIRNGIRFTGMPGWGGEDEENWKLVLFIRHLPDLSQDELEFMRQIQPEERIERHGH
jgi:mono/diheme cytochrome c family protein